MDQEMSPEFGYAGSLNPADEAFLDAIMVEITYIFAKRYPDELPPDVVKHLHPTFNRTIGKAFREDFKERKKWWLKEQKQVNDKVQTGRDYAADYVEALAAEASKVNPPISTKDLDDALKAISRDMMEIIRRLERRDVQVRFPICPEATQISP